MSKNLGLKIGVVILLGLVISLFMRLQSLESRMGQFTPIAVVDYLAIAKTYPPNSSEQEVQEFAFNVASAVALLKEEGFLILGTSGAVISAPDELFLPLDIATVSDDEK